MQVLPLIAEFFGTFLLLMSIFATGNALVIGGTLGLIVLLLGDISGGHVNPAVSVAMFMNGSIGTMDLINYTVVQCLGAAAAFYAYKVLS
jgi:glycerol uptake facilitator-like aquaporin